MKGIWKEDILVKSYDVDFNKRTKLNFIFNYMQEGAYNHACSLGAGFEELADQGYIWVLSRVKIVVARYPIWGEEITLETWPKGVNKLFALRDFEIKDIKGNVIISATTAWLVLDAKTLRPQRMQALKTPLPDNEGKFALDEVLEKLQFNGGFQSETLKRPGYSDIDVNKHVNNTKYVEWILDCMPEEFYYNRVISGLQLNFISEVKLGDEIIVKRGIINDNSYFVEGVNKENSNTVFQALIEWREYNENLFVEC